MNKTNMPHPYFLGSLVGFMMVAAFIYGYYLHAKEFYFIGSFLIGTGLVLWPLFALVVIVWLMAVKPGPESKKLWVRSLFTPPVGSVIAVVLMNFLV